MKKLIWILIAIIVIVLVIFRAKAVLERSAQQETKAEKIIPAVQVEPVKKGSLNLSLGFGGDIKGEEEVDIYPKATGKLAGLKVNEGDRVKKDQVLALVDRDVDGVKFEMVEVKSPIDGVVGIVYLDEGSSVSPPDPAPNMGTPLIRVINMERVKVVIDVTEEDLGKISRGQKAEIRIDAYPEKTFTGTVSLISPLVSQLTRTASVEITIPNPQYLLKPGMYAQANLNLGSKEGIILVPTHTILNESGKKKVYLLSAGKALPRLVQTGTSQQGWTEITDGLSENDSLIVAGQHLVKAGEPVKLITVKGGER